MGTRKDSVFPLPVTAWTGRGQHWVRATRARKTYLDDDILVSEELRDTCGLDGGHPLEALAGDIVEDPAATGISTAHSSGEE
jgi:hypothetical protein